jgi:hypothetical protein
MLFDKLLFLSKLYLPRFRLVGEAVALGGDFRVVSHIPSFGDAPTSPCEDAASPTGDAAPTFGRCGHRPLDMYPLLERCTYHTRDAASPTGNVASPAMDFGTSPNSGICATAEISSQSYGQCLVV